MRQRAISEHTFVAAAVALLSACAAKPVTAPRAVVPSTVESELRAAARQAPPFGDVSPIAVGVSNGSKATYDISAERILAVDQSGNRIAPLSPDEAARQAGGATVLIAGLKGAGTGALLSGVLGAVTGAIIGAGTGNAGQGAAVGAGIGVAIGAIGAGSASKTRTEAEIQEQLGGLDFGEQTLEPALPISGFVFFPKGTYTGVRVLAIRKPDGKVEDIYGGMVPGKD